MKTKFKILLILTFSLYFHSGFSQNPIIRDFFTADPAPIVHNGTVYLYTSHDTASVTSTNYEMKDYFFYHNGALPTGGSYRRSICIDYMYYNEDGTIQPIIQTKEGVNAIR
ncbi:MAG: hypothetical protein ACXIUD_00025 [Mongoliitalea sp.]